MNKPKFKKDYSLSLSKGYRNGFTLPELLVAMGLFLIVISIVAGAFVNSLRTQRATVELIAVNDNISLLLEQIARSGKPLLIVAE